LKNANILGKKHILKKEDYEEDYSNLLKENENKKINILQKINNSLNFIRKKTIKKSENSIIKKNILIENLLNEINIEKNKIIICKICKRKFLNKNHYSRHCNFSKLHQKNLEKN
jgi:hypothetical protein